MSTSTIFCDFRTGNQERHAAELMFEIAEAKETGASVNCRSCRTHGKDAIRRLISASFSDPVVGYVDLARGDTKWVWLESMEAVRLGAKQAESVDRSSFALRFGVHVPCSICGDPQADPAEAPEARFSFWLFAAGSSQAEYTHCCEAHVGKALGLCLLTPLPNPRIVWTDLTRDEGTRTLEHANALPVLPHCFE